MAVFATPEEREVDTSLIIFFKSNQTGGISKLKLVDYFRIRVLFKSMV